MTGKKKYEPPLRLDMKFVEALERFAETGKKEVGASITRSKKNKSPGRKAPTTKNHQTVTPSSRRKSTYSV